MFKTEKRLSSSSCANNKESSLKKPFTNPDVQEYGVRKIKLLLYCTLKTC